MSEYIVCIDDLEEIYCKYTDFQPETVFGHRLREQIIRCKDCRYFEIGNLKCNRTHLPTSLLDFCSHYKKRWLGI